MGCDVTGESTDALVGSCSQNTLKNKRLEHQSYRQERNFIDRERLNRETHSRVWNPVPPSIGKEGGFLPNLKNSPFLACVGLLFLLVLWPSWLLGFSQVPGASAFLRCHGDDLYYGTATSPLYGLDP
jgi:hypothetical protein